MTALSQLPPLPGFTALPQTYAAWPVWSDSTTKPTRFAPMPKKAAVRLWHRARDFDRGTHQQGKHGGSVGPTALAGTARVDLRLPEPPHRPPRPVLRGDRAQSRGLRPHRRHGAEAAARARDPHLGAPLRRDLARRAVRAGAGEQRLRRAARHPVARLQAARGAASARAGHLGRSTACATGPRHAASAPAISSSSAAWSIKPAWSSWWTMTALPCSVPSSSSLTGCAVPTMQATILGTSPRDGADADSGLLMRTAMPRLSGNSRNQDSLNRLRPSAAFLDDARPAAHGTGRAAMRGSDSHNGLMAMHRPIRARC